MHDGHYSDELLISFLDGELAREETRELGAHLDRCWSCRARCRELDEATALVSKLFGEADLAVSDSVERIRQPIFAAMERAQPCESRSKARMRSLRPVLLFAAALAAAAAVSRLVVLMPRPAAIGEVVAAPVKVPATPLPELPKAAPTMVASVAPFLKPLPVVPPPSQPVSPVDLDEVELALRFRLHQTGADLRDGAIRIRQEAGSVVVDGVVDDAAQASELEQIAAAADPGQVRVEVRLAKNVLPSPAIPYQIAAESSGTHPGPAFLPEMVPLLGSQTRLIERGNQAVATVEKMTDNAWAWRHLVERYGKGDALSAASRQLLESIEDDYRANIRTAGGELHDQLAFLPGWSADPAAACDTSDPAAQVLALRDLVEWLFAGRQLDQNPGSIKEAAQVMATRLACLEATSSRSQQ